jgi:hypothetical protein
MPRSFALAAALLPFVATPALAATTLTVDASTAILGVRAFAGVGVSDANLPCVDLEFPDEVEECNYTGSLGSFETRPEAVAPGVLAIAGSGTAFSQDFLWSATMSLEWSTWQQHDWAASGADLVLSGGGRHQSTLYSLVGGPGIPPGDIGTRSVFVQNLHTLVFTLDAPTAITYAGSWYGGYMPVQLARQDGATGEFIGEGNIPDSYSGLLEAGTYRLRNFHLLQSNFEDGWDYGWNYSLTFHDTALAVPEAPPLAMLAAGLAAIGWRCRRRGAGSRA